MRRKEGKRATIGDAYAIYNSKGTGHIKSISPIGFVFTVRERSTTVAIFIKMRCLTWYLVLAECLVFFAQAQDRHNVCSDIEPMQDFQMSRFLGEWYAIQDTARNGKCIIYNYTQIQKPGKYVMVVTEHISQVHSQTYPSSFVYGLIASEPSTPGRMETEYAIEFPPHVNNMPHVVFMTDYGTYAGVLAYLPDSLELTIRATILSRTRRLDDMHVDKIRQKLSQCGFDLSNLKIVEHSDCPKPSSFVSIRYNDTALIPV